MKVLFCHDGPLRKDPNNHYYGTAHNNDTFKRYYSLSEEIIALIRVREIEEKEAREKLSKITISPFEVIETPNASTLHGMVFNRRKTKEILKDSILNADYIVARLPSINGFLAIDIAKKLNKPYLVEVVACPWDAYWNHSWKGKIFAPFMYYSTKTRVNKAPYVLYVTNKFLQQRYPTKGKSIGCSDVSLPKTEDIVLENKQKYFEKSVKDKIVLGTTAAVNVRYKGQQYVIEAISSLNKEGYNFEYHIVGGGDNSYLKSLAEEFKIADKVKFLGSLPHDKVFDYLDELDIYIQPSKTEGLPRSLVEAMSRGCPAIGADAGGIPELLNPEFIFQRGSVKDLTKKLKAMNINHMKSESESNFNKAKKFNLVKLNEKREKFYSEFKTIVKE